MGVMASIYVPIHAKIFPVQIYIGVTIDTEKQVSLKATCRSDITTDGGTNSHRDDIATENSFSMGEREARSSGGLTLKEGGAQRPKG